MANETLTTKRLKTPNAAAIAGLLFSLLLITAFALLRISVPADPQEPGSLATRVLFTFTMTVQEF